MEAREPAVPVIRAAGVWKTYSIPGGGGVSHALRGADLEVFPGQVVVLFGRSGSGKTTLLNLLAGLDRPSQGRLEVEGRELAELGEAGRTRFRRERLGFVFQFFNLLPTLTALENVALSLELAGSPDAARARAALAQVDLAGKEGRFPHQLSGGEQQRVAVARALVKSPALILADEPTGNLDTRTGDAVLDLLTAHCRERGTALLMASHSPRTARVADRILDMVDGRLAERPIPGPPGRDGVAEDGAGEP